ncbi:kelch repeat and BTB domain-containing protein 8-like isoform X1 [Branchiostoma floridae x Branchiostoma belcheri]
MMMMKGLYPTLGGNIMAAAGQETNVKTLRPRFYHDRSYRHGFLGTVSDLQKAEVLQDVVLEVEGRRFPCHRLVLSAASPYFRAMFTSDMAESRQQTVVLKGLDAAMFGEILSYIYSGTLHVSLDRVQHLYQAADLLQLDYVRDTCSSYMAMNVERSTCVELYKFADAFAVDIVLNRCLQCICRHFAKVSISEEFCSLSVDQLTEIISHDELDVKEETRVWEAVVRWVQHSREDRLQHLPSILPHIRFNLLTSGDTAAILEHPLVREDPGISEVIRNEVQMETSSQKTRVGMDTQEMALLFGSSKREMLCMNPRVGRYISCGYPADLPPVVTTTVTSDNDIYILAGHSHAELSLFMYNHVGNTWEHVSSVSRSRGDDLPSDEYLVEVDGCLYYLAVKLSLTADMLVWVRRYNRHTNQWEDCVQPTLEGTSDISVALSCGPYLYFFTNAEMHRYDPEQDRWSKRTPLNTIPLLCTAVAMGTTEIFCTDTRFGKMAVYDTESDDWRMVSTELPPPRRNASFRDFNRVTVLDSPSLFVLENQLHVVLRSYSGVPVEADDWKIFVWDRVTGDWRDLTPSLPAGDWKACGPVCCVARMYLPCLNKKRTGTRSIVHS